MNEPGLHEPPGRITGLDLPGLEGYVAPMPAHVMTPEMARRPETPEELKARMERHRRLLVLLDQWALEDPEYDERVGALLEAELLKDRVNLTRADDHADDFAA